MFKVHTILLRTDPTSLLGIGGISFLLKYPRAAGTHLRVRASGIFPLYIFFVFFCLFNFLLMCPRTAVTQLRVYASGISPLKFFLSFPPFDLPQLCLFLSFLVLALFGDFSLQICERLWMPKGHIVYYDTQRETDTDTDTHTHTICRESECGCHRGIIIL